MNTKLRVEYDFNKKEPYLELSLNAGGDQYVTMPDQMLREFAALAENLPVIFVPSSFGRNICELRVVESDIDVSYQENLLIKFAEWAKPYFYNGVDGELAKDLGSTYKEFFNRLYSQINPSLGNLYPRPCVINYFSLRHYFETFLPQEARMKAFDNTPREKWDEEFETFSGAMQSAFDHHKSPEGAKYWSDVILKVSKNNNGI